LGLTFGLVLPQLTSVAQELTSKNYRAEAKFLVAFTNFVEWPKEAFPSAQAPFLLCVYGTYPFGVALAEEANGSSAQGKALQIRLVGKGQELRACHILFISQFNERECGRILGSLRGASVLTVGETPDFLESGGAIEFLRQGQRLRFDVNLHAAGTAHLKVRSTMLTLARRVIPAETAKQ
jgi:hypothetical protein